MAGMERLAADPRRLGTVLLSFGTVGVVLAGILAVSLVAGALATRSLDERLEADRASLVSTLERAGTAVDNAARATDNLGTTLATTARTLDDTGAALADLAGAAAALGKALDVSILGQRPLADAAARFAEFGGRLEVFAVDASDLAGNLDTNRRDIGEIAADLRFVSERLDQLGTRVAEFDRLAELVGMLTMAALLAGGLVAWMAAAAGFCAWAGWQLRSQRDPSLAPPATEPPPAVAAT
jgi:hypothetical protein